MTSSDSGLLPDRRALEREAVSDAEFGKMLHGWLIGFHGDIKPITEEILNARVASYIHQEKAYQEKVRFVLHHLGDRPERVLDVGSSAGGLSVALAQAGLQVEGIEPIPSGVEVSVARARRAGVENVHFRVGVGEAMPYADESFDLVISVAVLEHVQDPRKVVEETFRVLRPGGRAYFEVPNYLYPFEPHYKIAWLPMMPKPLGKRYVKARGFFPDFLDHLNYMNRFIISRHFREVGFTDLRDLYGDYIAGKAFGAEWTTGKARLEGVPVGGAAVRSLMGWLPTAYFANRAVFLLATRP